MLVGLGERTLAEPAGMADIATHVIHNVGNALNTVNVSTEVLAERLGQSKVAGLARSAAGNWPITSSSFPITWRRSSAR